MRLSIIGHGPSLAKQNFGADIDAHDQVMRMKPSLNLTALPDIWGTKTSYVVGSFVAARMVLDNWCKHCRNYFIFIDTRTEDVTDADIVNMRDNVFGPDFSCVIAPELCKKWINVYRDIRGPMNMYPAQEAKGARLSDHKGHKHFSIGMFSLIHALEFLSPAEITLYGFDNVATGQFTWSVTRGAEYDQYPDHNWQAEHMLLQDLCAAYKYKCFIENDTNVIRLIYKGGE